MTSENIMITMQDVDLVCQCDPTFHRQLVIAATARVRAENNMQLNNLDNQNGTTEKVTNESSKN
jgi:hypothetical protein